MSDIEKKALEQLKKWFEDGAVISRTDPNKPCLVEQPDGTINTNLTIKFEQPFEKK
jgi:hypothetical protein